MNLQQWLNELKRLISVLPEDEQKRVEEFYLEMFADKKEAGRTEAEILAELNTPVETAKDVIAEYKAENPNFVPPAYDPQTGYAKKPTSGFQPEPYLTPKESDPAKTERNTTWTVVSVLGIFPVILLYIVMISISIGLVSTLVALYGSALFVLFLRLGLLGVGLCLVLLGISILCTVLFSLVIHWGFKGIQLLIQFVKKSILGENK